MDSEKQGSSSSSDSSSEEQSDRCDPVKEDSDSFSKRSYGCIFCKRGFTNAQALGGHMNIHRKDRANKAKQITSSSSSSPPPSKEVDQSTITNNPYLVPVSLMYCPSAMEVQMNYRPLAPNPHGEVSHWFVPRSSRGLNMNQELWGSDLSLQIRPNDDLGRMGVCNGDGVDLELRLGHHP